MKQLLGDLSALSARTHASERRIHDRAMARDGEVSVQLDKLGPTAMFDDGASKEYQTLVLERAKLAQVIGLARMHLGS
jgi:hypothetical protein